MKLLEELKSLILKDKQSIVWKKESWVLFALVGVLLAVICMPVGTSEVEEKVTAIPTTSVYKTEVEEAIVYQQQLTERLKEVLAQIEGVGEVEILLTLESTKEEVVYESQTVKSTSLQEEDSLGGSRVESTKEIMPEVVLQEGKAPYIIKTLLPKVQGILVIAEGGDDATVKKDITDTLEVLFGIGVHKIKVVKKEVEDW